MHSLPMGSLSENTCESKLLAAASRLLFSRMLVPLEPTAVWNGGMSGKNLLLVAGGWKFIQLMAAVLVSNRDTSFQAAKENALE